MSSGRATTTRELAEEIKDLIGFQGQVVWDDSKPDGQMEKVFGVKRLAGMGLACSTPLREGLSRTIDWLSKNYDSRGDGIRL